MNILINELLRLKHLLIIRICKFMSFWCIYRIYIFNIVADFCRVNINVIYLVENYVKFIFILNAKITYNPRTFSHRCI